MFSANIQRLLNQSNASSATERAAQLEQMVDAQLKTMEPPKTNGEKFSDFMKMEPPADFKFKVQEPKKISRNEISTLVEDASEKIGIDPKLVMAVIKQESGFNPNAVSKVGALGLMQLMPTTAKAMGVENAFSPKENIEGGAKYLKNLIDKFNGNKILALAAYNAGPNAVAKYNGIPPYKETQNYVKSILKNYL